MFVETAMFVPRCEAQNERLVGYNFIHLEIYNFADISCVRLFLSVGTRMKKVTNHKKCHFPSEIDVEQNFVVRVLPVSSFQRGGLHSQE